VCKQRMGSASAADEKPVCFISGGAGGIGRAICHKFVGEGYRVAVADVDHEAGRKVARELGDDALFVACNVRSEESIVDAFRQTVLRWGSLQCAVLAAGMLYHRHATPLQDINICEFDDTLAVNLRGAFLCLRQAARVMKQTGTHHTSIVLISSIAGIRGSTADPSYAISKAAVISLAQFAAAKLVMDGVRVNCISPTGVRTPMLTDLLNTTGVGADEQRLAKAARRMFPLLSREVEPHEMAAIVYFLCSDAALNINGVNIPVDQGWAAGVSRL